MVTVNITVTDEAVQPEIYLGRQGEKQAREIVFDLSALREKYGAGTATLYHQRSKDPAPYLIAETTGTTMTWTVSETDTVYAGIGYCEFRYTFGTEGLSKSTMFATNVKASLSGDVIIPAALQAWYDAIIDYIDTHSGGGGGGSGLTNDIKDALLKIAEKAVYVDDGGQTYYNDLLEALYPTVRYSVTNTLSGCATSNDATTAVSGSSYSATITANTGYSLTGATVSVTMDGIDITSTAYNNGVISIASVSGDIVITVTAVAITLTGINAAYTQSGTVYDTDTLDSLKTDLVVTAHYSDSSTQTVLAADYTLSGTLMVGTSAITVTYGGKTTTFNVTVTEKQTIHITYTQGSIGSGNTDANRVTGVITDLLHFGDESYRLSVANGYLVYPFGFTAKNDESYAGTRSGNNLLYAYAVSDSGYIPSKNTDIGGTLSANGVALADKTGYGWVTDDIIYSFAKTGSYDYSFKGLGFLVKKNDESSILPEDVASVVTFELVEA